MDAAWAAIISAAVTGSLTLFGSVVPKLGESKRVRRAREAKAAADRATAVAYLRKIYLAAHTFLDEADEPEWVTVAAAAADCIPYTKSGSDERAMLVKLIGHTQIDAEEFIANLPDS